MSNVFTVTKVNEYIKNVFVRDGILSRISIEGEISECKYHSSGHIYFTMKDKTSQLSCIMFAGNRASLDFKLEPGLSVVASGQIDVYTKSGSYSFIVRSIKKSGAGALFEEFEKLKRKLYEEGLFDKEHKKPIPKYVKKIGIITAKTGDAINDITKIAHERNPYVQLVLIPAKVQGEGSAESVIRALNRADKMGFDVLIVGRGGGSYEDLGGTFNDEALARAVYAMNTPVISAVGHEPDVTLIDYVSDLRASTPSNASELAVYRYNDLMAELVDFHSELLSLMMSKIEKERDKLAFYAKQLEYRNPRNALEQKRVELDKIYDRISELVRRSLEATKDELCENGKRIERALKYTREHTIHRLELYREMLRRLSPLEKISGGYAFVSHDDRGIRSVDEVNEGAMIDVTVIDGTFSCEVKKKWKK